MALRPFRNARLKIAALGLGFVLWITVSGQQVERTVLVQLQFRNLPASLEITGDAPRTVDVRVHGAAGLISRLEPTEVVATVDLTDARPGLRVFPLTSGHISVPLGVDVRSVDPSAVSLTLEKSAPADVAVKPTIDGQPAPGYEVADVTWEPKTVGVVGPESHIKERPLAVTERISIEGAKATVIETVSMGVSDPAVRLRESRAARVTIKIVAAPVARFADLPVVFRNLPPEREVTLDPATVTVTVRMHQATSGPNRKIDPYVDLAGLAPGRYTLQVHVDSHDEYAIGTIEPATVAVRIR